jgi:DNA polymerase III sliding clamp (beta) subunit (PCNA family)
MKVDPISFSKILGMCSKFASTRDLVPVLKCFKFSGYRISTTDGSRGIIYEMENPFDTTFFVPSDLLTIFGNLEQVADIEVDSEYCRISSGRFKTKIPLFRGNYTYPEMPSEIEKLPDKFLDYVREVYFAVTKDETKPEMRGVFVDKNVFYATNNRLIVRYTAPIEFASSFLIPDTLLELVIGNEPLGYTFLEDKFWFWYQNYLVFCSLIKKSFPDCKGIFDFYVSKPPEIVCSFDLSSMISALRRLEPFAEGILIKKISVLVTDKCITFKGTNPNVGEAEEEIDSSGLPSGTTWSFDVSFELFSSLASRINRFSLIEQVLCFSDGGPLEGLLTTVKKN